MNILIANDDGIESPGLARLAAAAREFGNVTVIAPDGERSANSHYITLLKPIDVYPAFFPVNGVKAYATTGTPADCIRFGIKNFMKSGTDVVLTGINFGYNCGNDIQYSATVGAAMEAACAGVHAIAVSEGAHGCHEVTDRYLCELLEELFVTPLARNEIWNLNFPECPLYEFKGILRNRKVDEAGIYNDIYAEQMLPGGGIRLAIAGSINEEASDGTDLYALMHNYISIGKVSNLK